MSTTSHLDEDGRTTRMLQAAEEQIKQGETVTVVFATTEEYQCHTTQHLFLSSPCVIVKIFDPDEETIWSFLTHDQKTTFINHSVFEKHFSIPYYGQ